MKTYLITCQEYEGADVQIVTDIQGEDRDDAQKRLVRAINEFEIALPGYTDSAIVNFIEVIPTENGSIYGPDYVMSTLPDDEYDWEEEAEAEGGDDE